jgi:hypothetical protein
MEGSWILTKKRLSRAEICPLRKRHPALPAHLNEQNKVASPSQFVPRRD